MLGLGPRPHPAHVTSNVIYTRVSFGSGTETYSAFYYLGLHLAAKKGDIGEVKHLVNKGADINIKNDDGVSD